MQRRFKTYEALCRYLSRAGVGRPGTVASFLLDTFLTQDQAALNRREIERKGICEVGQFGSWLGVLQSLELLTVNGDFNHLSVAVEVTVAKKLRKYLAREATTDNPRSDLLRRVTYLESEVGLLSRALDLLLTESGEQGQAQVWLDRARGQGG
jgi:hypothetical protein